MKSKNIIRRKISRLLILPLLFVTLLWMIPTEAGAESRQVYDNASIFSEEEIMLLTDAVDELEDLTDWDAMVITVDDPAVFSAQNYAEEKFNELTSKDDGIVYLLDMNGRELYIATAGEAFLYMVDVRLNEALDDAFPYAKEGDYAQAMNAMIKATESFYEEGIVDGLTVYNEDDGTYAYYTEKPEHFISFGEIIMAVIAGVAACVIFSLVIMGKYRLKFGRYRYNVRENAIVDLTKKEDHLVNQFVTRRKIPRDPPPSSKGGGGTSTIHTGAGGRSFGGGGRKF